MPHSLFCCYSDPHSRLSHGISSHATTSSLEAGGVTCVIGPVPKWAGAQDCPWSAQAGGPGRSPEQKQLLLSSERGQPAVPGASHRVSHATQETN